MNFQDRLEKELSQVLCDFDKAGIQHSKHIDDIIVNKRAKARFGCCKRYKRKFGSTYYIIEISSFLEDADDKQLRNIIGHEVLHTVSGCYNHGKKWKIMAKLLNKTCGYNITTTTSYNKVGVEDPRKADQYKYAIRCTGCGKTFYRKRSCPLTQNPSNYRCGVCGGKLKSTSLNKTK